MLLGSKASQTDPISYYSPGKLDEYKYHVALAEFIDCKINQPSAFANADALAYASRLHMHNTSQPSNSTRLPPLPHKDYVDLANSIIKVPLSNACPKTIGLGERHWMFQMCRLLSLYMDTFGCPITLEDVRTDPFAVVTNNVQEHRIKVRFYEILELPWAYVLIFRGAAHPKDTLHYINSTIHRKNNALTENARAAHLELLKLKSTTNKPVVIAGWSMGAAMACLAYGMLNEVQTPVYLYGPVIPSYIVKPNTARVVYMNTDRLVRYVSCIAHSKEDVEFEQPGGHDIHKLYDELLNKLQSENNQQRGGNKKLVISNRLPSAKTK